MIERDKEYYNKKIGELYAVIENQEKIIRDLQDRNSKAIEYINENVYEEDNDCGYYWWEIKSKEEILNILKGKK